MYIILAFGNSACSFCIETIKLCKSLGLANMHYKTDVQVGFEKAIEYDLLYLPAIVVKKGEKIVKIFLEDEEEELGEFLKRAIHD